MIFPFYRPTLTLRLVLSVALSFFVACAPARKPVPPGAIPSGKPLTTSEEQYGHEILAALTERYKLDYNHPRAQEVQTVVDRLTAAAKADKDPWHVYILQHPTLKNAAATRGNHVFIWSAMLDYTQNEDELAGILAHEISHVLAGHTDPDPNEEIKKMLINIGALAAGMAVSIAVKSPSYSADLGRITSGLTQELGNSFLVYPFSRDSELEADQIGLFLMADAKYDPRKAIEFWRRSKNDPSFSSGPGFLSTHPPAAERLQQFEKLLPAAMARYEGKAAPPTPGAAPTAPQIIPMAGAPVAAPNAAPPPANDSFDLNAKPGTQPAVDSPPPPAEGTDWQITATKAILYQSPLKKSRKLGELSQGALVNVISVNGAWLEISRPEHGYVRSVDAERK